MKQKQYCLLGIVAILALVFILPGCSEEQKSPVEVSSLDSNEMMNLGNFSSSYCLAHLYAGQDIFVGWASVSNNQKYLYVSYSLKSGYSMTEAHAWVAEITKPLPKNFAPGSFPYGKKFAEAKTIHNFVIPLSELGVENGDTLYIAIHAVITGLGVVEETAWGKGACYDCGPTHDFEKKWGWYFEYTVVF